MRLVSASLIVALFLQLFVPVNVGVAADIYNNNGHTVLEQTIVESGNNIKVKWLIAGEKENTLNFSINVNGVKSNMVFERTTVQKFDESTWIYTYNFPKDPTVQEYNISVSNQKIGMEELHFHHTLGDTTKDILLPSEKPVEVPIPEIKKYIDSIWSTESGQGVNIFLNAVHEDVKNISFFSNGQPITATKINDGATNHRQYLLSGLVPEALYNISVLLLNENSQLLQVVPYQFGTKPLPPTKEEIVDIQDKNLLEAIQKRLGITNRDFVTNKELSTIMGLHIEKEVKDFSPLKYAKNLNFVTFNAVNIDSGAIEVLSQLENLDSLTFYHIEQKDWSFIKSFTNLYTLNFQNTNFNDLGLLPSGLSELFFFYNSATNYEKLLSKSLKFAMISQSNLDQYLTKEIKAQLENQGLSLEASDTIKETSAVTVNVTNQTANTVSVKWDNPEKKVTHLKINNQQIFETDGNTYTFSNLTANKNYFVELFIAEEYDELGTYGFINTNTLPGEKQNSDKIELSTTVENNKVSISNDGIDEINSKGTATINITETVNNSVSVYLTSSQLENLFDKEAVVDIERSDVTISVPTKNLLKGKDVSFNFERLKNDVNAIAPVYSFNIIQTNNSSTDRVSNFSEPVTLRFKVDKEKVVNPANVAAHYYNPKTGKWENIGGKYDVDSGILTVTTSHFSTFTVLEVQENQQKPVDQTNPIAVTKPGDSNSGSSVKDSNTSKIEPVKLVEKSSKENKLPNTATNSYNYLLVGLLLIVSGGVFLVKGRKLKL